MSFYLTLPSDSSMNYFPENKISHFITRFPQEILLHGAEYECTLTEILYPHHVNAQNNLIGFVLEENGKKLARRIPYETVSDIIKAIIIKDHPNKIWFHYNPVTKRIKVKKNGAKVILHDGLAQMLGFEPCTIECVKGESVDSPYVADPCIHYRVLLVYSDIVQPQIGGDVLVNVTGSDGPVCRRLWKSLEERTPHG